MDSQQANFWSINIAKKNLRNSRSIGSFSDRVLNWNCFSASAPEHSRFFGNVDSGIRVGKVKLLASQYYLVSRCPILIYNLLQHWIANNLFGIAFAINGIEMLLLNKMVIGCILLGGLFVYDVFWVFYTDVMVTVAKSFEAPIKRKWSIKIWQMSLEKIIQQATFLRLRN